MYALSLIIILLQISFILCCHSFKDTNVTVVSETGEKYYSAITGCLERKELEPATAVEISVNNQRVPKLEKDAVRHLRHLSKLTFSDCQIEVVENGVFRNVPSLQEVKIVKNKLREVVSGAFSSLERLEVLDLSRNEIERVENGALGNSTLEKVYLGFNRLVVWAPDWFGNPTNVKVIDFQHNKITEIPKKAFDKFRRIENICFDYNDLEVIQPEVFGGITHLKYLGLRYNKLKTVNVKSFPNRIVIDKLRIDANHLNFLPLRLLAVLEVRDMTVLGNPWKCPCMDQINTWLHETNGTVKDPEFCQGHNIPVCRYSSTFSYTCRQEIDEDLTQEFFNQLKRIQPPLKQYCARLE